MTLLPLTECCLLLGVDPKTLRLWLTSAHLSCTAHPGDARLKCLTHPQLQHLATVHGRVLPEPLPPSAPLPAQAASAEARTGPGSSPLSSAEAAFRPLLIHLQTQVATLQEQVTHLALALLREREWHGHDQTAPPPALLPSEAMATLPVRHAPSSRTNQPVAPLPPHPRSRSRALPLIEYGADGRYVVICPTQGVLSLVPDSPEWFAWLASLTAFTFQGAQGRFSTTRKLRKGQRVQAWSAYRSLHGRSCNLYLGLTSHLTLARLEEIAATMYARLTTS
jgi:hypothetical protein